MANICYNEFLLSCNPECTQKYEKLLDDLNEEIPLEITYSENGIIEGWCESKWVFPIDIFEKIINENVPKEDSVYFRCLSTEWGNAYVAMNRFKDNSWCMEQCFNL